MSPRPSPAPVSKPTRRVVVGTAGHIDHGKTQLVRVLTGTDCDRWEEEKKRGITIDLGFAQMVEEDLQVGFVDVPGHQRFLHNALAGMGGIRIVLLVVAATEGVMPQTREHIAICSLLGIPSAVVALTKIDLASPDLVELAELELEEYLQGSIFAGAPILRVSSHTGEGIEELRSTVLELASRFEVVPDLEEPAHLPIDRAFQLRGLGTVVTGTLASGRIPLGGVLEALPGGGEVRVRSIQVHGEARDEALAGERTSLQVAGHDLGSLARGVRLVDPGAFLETTSVCARLTWLDDLQEALEEPVLVRLHLYSSEALGFVRPLVPSPLEPGQTGVVEIRLHGPLVATRGDRFVLRRPTPATTLGGGEVLDPLWERRQGRVLAPVVAALTAGGREACLQWLEDSKEQGGEAEALARRLGRKQKWVEGALAAATEEGKLREIEPWQESARRWVSQKVYQKVVERTAAVLEEYFRRDRLAKGIPKAEALRRILPEVTQQVGRAYLSWLSEDKVLVLAGEWVGVPGREVELASYEAELAKQIGERFEADFLDPPSEAQLREDYAEMPKVLDASLRVLLESKCLCRLPNGALVSTVALNKVHGSLVESGWERFSVAQFKERFGLSRKWAIPLLEYFDSKDLTRRVGNERMILALAAASLPQQAEI